MFCIIQNNYIDISQKLITTQKKLMQVYLLFAEDYIDKHGGCVHHLLTADCSNDAQPLHGFVLVVHLVWKSRCLRTVCLTQITPLSFTTIFWHTVKHFLHKQRFFLHVFTVLYYTVIMSRSINNQK